MLNYLSLSCGQEEIVHFCILVSRDIISEIFINTPEFRRVTDGERNFM